MAVSFESLVSSLILFASAATAWLLAMRAGTAARAHVRFGAVLFAALAVACAMAALNPAFAATATVVALLVAALGSAALALGVGPVGSVSRKIPPLVASLVLVAALGAGGTAALTGQPVFAVAAQVLVLSAVIAGAVGGLGVTPLRSVQVFGGAASLLCGGMILMDAVAYYALLFFAAGLLGLGLASQRRVEQPG